MSVLGRGASWIRALGVPSACFGTGYAFCWTRDREETVPQLFACSALGAWAGFARGLRHLKHSLPETVEWPRAKLAHAEAIELRVLAQGAKSCETQGLACALLWRIVLQRFCDYAIEEGPQGLAINGLAPVVEHAEGEVSQDSSKQGSGLLEFAALLDASARQTAISGPDPELLQPMSAALCAVVEQKGRPLQQDLGTLGILRITNVALVASTMLAQLQMVPSARAESNAEAFEESVAEASKELQKIWQALSLPGVAPAARSAARHRGSPEEIKEVCQDVSARFTALQAKPQPLRVSPKPLLEELPSGLAGRLKEALRDKQTTTVTVPPEAAATKEIERPKSLARKVGKLVELAAWATLISGAVVAISADGLGVLPVHVLPPTWQQHLQAALRQRAIRVEELLAQDDLAARGCGERFTDTSANPFFSAVVEGHVQD